MSNKLVWSNNSTDVSGELLAQVLDGDFTKDAHENARGRDPMTAALKDKDNKIIFYGVVKVPEWFKFDEDRMFCNPANSRKLLKKNDALGALTKKKIGALKYYRISRGSSYTRFRDVLGAKFDLVDTLGSKVVGTVANSTEYTKLCSKARFACKHLPSTTRRYRIYLGHPDVTPVLGATISEHRELSFREAVLFDSTEEARVHVDSLFEEGILNENMGVGFKAWTEEKHLTGADLTADKNYPIFEKLSSHMNELFNIDFCAVDLVITGNKKVVVVTNVVAAPGLQADSVLAFVSTYFKKLTEEGRTITPEHIKRLVEGMSPGQLDTVAKLFKKALGMGA